MTIFSFISVIAREPLLFRQISLTPMLFLHRSSPRKDDPTGLAQGPPTAFQWFSQRTVAEFPDKTDNEISKNLSSNWKGRSQSENSSDERDSTNKKEIYNLALAKLPKKPPGVFSLFVKENYSKVETELIPGVSAREVMPALSNKWKNLSNEEKEQLKQKHGKLQEEYKQQVIRFWQELNPNERAFLEEKQGPKMKQLAKERQHFLGHPKSPPSPFVLFVQRFANGMKTSSVIERTKILGQKWNELSEREKEVYFEENHRAHEQYKKDLAIWKAKYPEVS